jgi:hypothetical protein
MMKETVVEGDEERSRKILVVTVPELNVIR